MWLRDIYIYIYRYVWAESEIQNSRGWGETLKKMNIFDDEYMRRYENEHEKGFKIQRFCAFEIVVIVFDVDCIFVIFNLIWARKSY